MVQDLFGSVFEEKWKEKMVQALNLGEAPVLDTYPFTIAEDKFRNLRLIGEGLGSNVYVYNNDWVVKIASDRHRDVIAKYYTPKQLESYLFLRNNIGEEFVTVTYLFSCPFWGRQRGCAVQPYIHGRQLKAIDDLEIQSNPALQKNLLRLVKRILTTYHSTGRIPDLWDMGFRKSARYTKNIIVDQNLNPWIVDIGAWPEGFSTKGGIIARIRILKIISDLQGFEYWLEKLLSV